VHDAGDRRMRMVADGIRIFVFSDRQFRRRRNELPRDRIVGVIGVDQCGDIRRYRDRIARANLLQIGKISRRGQSMRFDTRRGARDNACCVTLACV